MKYPKISNYIFLLFVFTILLGCSSATEKQIATIPFFPGRHGWDLAQFTITDSNNNVLNFKRVDCVWVVGNENNPSDESKVSALAERLVNLTPVGLVEIKSDRYGDFKVGEASFSRKVILTFKDKTSFTLFIGSPALTKPVYIRLADQKEVYWIDEPLLKQIILDKNIWLANQES